MPHKKSVHVDQTGLNLIRIIIGSYFMALSLDLVKGFDPGTLFATSFSSSVADLLGCALLLGLSGCFMAGIQLRLAALSLALMIFSSSLVQNFVIVTPDSLSAFWRDLTLAVAVLLTYLTLGRHELRRASVLAHRARLHRVLTHKTIRPRRITPLAGQKRPIQQEIRYALSMRARLKRLKSRPQDPEPENIFANL
ncbi:hypothetical protein [uncultured Roseovarius sp.]|uniref:hypothetical protein n=1 Tax=uncultured Roseovarius sp. TaxID=293344 RepID=UPI00261695C5|nr:hypothetical protein [uncultured Roseovarius sp.]